MGNVAFKHKIYEIWNILPHYPLQKIQYKKTWSQIATYCIPVLCSWKLSSKRKGVPPALISLPLLKKIAWSTQRILNWLGFTSPLHCNSSHIYMFRRYLSTNEKKYNDYILFSLLCSLLFRKIRVRFVRNRSMLSPWLLLIYGYVSFSTESMTLFSFFVSLIYVICVRSSIDHWNQYVYHLLIYYCKLLRTIPLAATWYPSERDKCYIECIDRKWSACLETIHQLSIYTVYPILTY